MGNYSIPFIAQGVFGRRSLFLYILLVSTFFSAGVKSLVTCLMHARKSEREEEEEGGEEVEKTTSDFFLFSLCVFRHISFSVGRSGWNAERLAEVGKGKKKGYLLSYIVASNCKTHPII